MNCFAIGSSYQKAKAAKLICCLNCWILITLRNCFQPQIKIYAEISSLNRGTGNDCHFLAHSIFFQFQVNSITRVFNPPNKHYFLPKKIYIIFFEKKYAAIFSSNSIMQKNNFLTFFSSNPIKFSFGVTCQHLNFSDKLLGKAFL
jgi:hypothetical protein